MGKGLCVSLQAASCALRASLPVLASSLGREEEKGWLGFLLHCSSSVGKAREEALRQQAGRQGSVGSWQGLHSCHSSLKQAALP